MTDLNDVVLVARLTKDCEFGYISNGTAKAVLSVASNRAKKVGEEWQEEVSYFSVTVWGKTAENLKPYFVKGKQLLIHGYLKQDRWEKDGEKKSYVSIVAEQVQLMGAKPDSNDPNYIVDKAAPVEAQKLAEAVGGEIFNEDIPF